MSVAVATESSPAGRLVKFVQVRRSNRTPTLYWWSLPLSPRVVASLYAGSLAGARAVVHPASALGSERAALGARDWPGGTACVDNIPALLQARDEGRVGPCTMAFFPPTARDEELEHRVANLERDLERLPFTIAMIPEGDGRARHRFCFRVPGKVIEGLESLALDRSFGGNAGQVEMALLQGLGLRPNHAVELRLVMQDGKAQLVGTDGGGRRRVQLLESGLGYTGLYEELSLREAVGERWREGWRRFPIGVVMFVGLPFFIAAFWIGSLMRKRPPAGPKPGPAR